ncbi:MAG: hypothetical protein M1834_006939 [Cirrosporium novae-zelandiae]|nr:MAG: hypothetical protein M1834_006939 [Cirrosporium novae-zelandiae]
MPPSSALSAPIKRRTNSLGRAKSDCHTCAKENRSCDRQRPKCGTCLRLNLTCGGYVLDLSWRDGLSSRKPFNPGATSADKAESSQADEDADQVNQRVVPLIREYKFKVGRPKRKRVNWRVKESQNGAEAGVSSSSQQCTLSKNHTVASGMVDSSDSMWMVTLASHRVDEDVTDDTEEVDSSSPKTDSNSSSTTTDDNSSTFTASSTGLQITIHQNRVSHRTRNSSIDSTSQATPYLPKGMLYAHLVDKYNGVLLRYNKEFCMLPLTVDFENDLNPFRCPQIHSRSADFLFHAVLALASHHLSVLEDNKALGERALQHQASALQQYRKAIGSGGGQTMALLDALIDVNRCFKGAQSGLGPWRLHLAAALNMIQRGGGVELLAQSAKLRTQTSMLIWWDATVALVARSNPIFPLSYLLVILRFCHSDGWSFWILNGCPEFLVISMFKISRAAWLMGEFPERAVEHLDEVRLVEKELIKWQNPYKDDDRFHTVEAWRQCLLLYIYRIFRYNIGAGPLQMVALQAIVVLEHAQCIPQTSFLQKQVLLPVFLAGCECLHPIGRQFAKRYCAFWDDTCRYRLFRTAHDILEHVWAELDSKEPDLWWGPIIDRCKEKDQVPGMKLEFLFG